jgi:8-oxo-dGTP pyrophosphatase MutT (NUDIX family)
MNDKPNGLKLGWHLKRSRYFWKTIWNRGRRDIIRIEASKKNITYTYLEHDGSVFVVPYTKDKKFVLIKCYRWTTDRFFWEIPAGIIADKHGQALEEIAREEMKEEAGCVSGRLESLGAYYSANGVMSLKGHFFLAHDVDYSGQSSHEEGEVILERKLLDVQELKEWIKEGKIEDTDTLLALLLSFQRLGL